MRYPIIVVDSEISDGLVEKTGVQTENSNKSYAQKCVFNTNKKKTQDVIVVPSQVFFNHQDYQYKKTKTKHFRS